MKSLEELEVELREVEQNIEDVTARIARFALDSDAPHRMSMVNRKRFLLTKKLRLANQIEKLSKRNTVAVGN